MILIIILPTPIVFCCPRFIYVIHITSQMKNRPSSSAKGRNAESSLLYTYVHRRGPFRCYGQSCGPACPRVDAARIRSGPRWCRPPSACTRSRGWPCPPRHPQRSLRYTYRNGKRSKKGKFMAREFLRPRLYPLNTRNQINNSICIL